MDIESDCVVEGVCDDVLVPLPVGEPVPLTDALIVEVDESVPLSLPLNDGPAPFVTDAEGISVVEGTALEVEVVKELKLIVFDPK